LAPPNGASANEARKWLIESVPHSIPSISASTVPADRVKA